MVILKVVRFWNGQEEKWGILKNEEVQEISWKEGIPGKFGECPGECQDFLMNYILSEGKYPLGTVRLLSPCRPTKIIGIGLNYRTHAEEVGLNPPQAPIFFIKPSTAVIGPEDKIILPAQSRRVDYEAELGVVIGRRARNVPRDRAKDYVLGYTCANDVTARDLQPPDGQWTYSKSFDTFAPLGPWIETEIGDPRGLDVVGLLNGREVQRGKVSDLFFGVEDLISYISACMTLLPGDVIMTGTPSGIGPLKAGDVFTVKIDRIGELHNRAAID